MDKRNVSVRLECAFIEELDTRASRDGISRSELMRRLLTLGLEEVPLVETELLPEETKASKLDEIFSDFEANSTSSNSNLLTSVVEGLTVNSDVSLPTVYQEQPRKQRRKISIEIPTSRKLRDLIPEPKAEEEPLPTIEELANLDVFESVKSLVTLSLHSYLYKQEHGESTKQPACYLHTYPFQKVMYEPKEATDMILQMGSMVAAIDVLPQTKLDFPDVKWLKKVRTRQDFISKFNDELFVDKNSSWSANITDISLSLLHVFHPSNNEGIDTTPYLIEIEAKHNYYAYPEKREKERLEQHRLSMRKSVKKLADEEIEKGLVCRDDFYSSDGSFNYLTANILYWKRFAEHEEKVKGSDWRDKFAGNIDVELFI